MGEQSPSIPSTPSEPHKSLLTTMTAMVQRLCTSALSTAQTILDSYIPPTRQTAITARVKSFAQDRPLVTSFLVAHVVVSGLPLLLFVLQIISVLIFSLATALIVGVLCALAFTAACVGLASCVLVPVLFVTGFLGVAAWFWAWVGWYSLRWAGVVGQDGDGSLAVTMHQGKNRDAGRGADDGEKPGNGERSVS